MSNKVKITYAIDLNKVPNRTQELITEAYYWLSGALSKLETLRLDDEAVNFQSHFDQIDFIRRALANVDQRLDDCTAIMQGYHQAVLDLNSPPHESPQDIEKMNEQLRLLQEQSKILSEQGGDDE
tara:strand:- start:556 stop:930 length:375 start_codon:yes stop_codon:yes gene_type:complete